MLNIFWLKGDISNVPERDDIIEKQNLGNQWWWW